MYNEVNSTYNAFPVGTVVEAFYRYNKEKYAFTGVVIGYVEKNRIAVLPPGISQKRIHFSDKNSKTDRVIIEVRRYSEKRGEFTGTTDYYAMNPNRVTQVSPNTTRFYEDNLDVDAADLKEDGDE